MSVKMWPTLPKDNEANGLPVIEKDLIADPARVHVVVALLNRKRLKVEDDAGETIPTARIMHIEVLDGDEADTARDLMMAALRARTGSQSLPFDGEPDPDE